MSRDYPTNRDDIIDSRDVIRRIRELENERDTHKDATETYAEENNLPFNAEAEQEAWEDSEEGRELATLQALADDADGYAEDWKYGCTLIRDSYFERYAQDLAADIGALDKCTPWPATCIDWEKAADELKQDYTSVEFDGETYWVR